MDDKNDSFKDYAYRGIDAFLKLTAKAGESIKTASNNAIEKIDSLQLEKQLEQLYVRLGKQSYALLSAEGEVIKENSEISITIEAIEAALAELESRKESSAKPK